MNIVDGVMECVDCGLCSLAAMAYMGDVPSRSVTVFVKSLCYLTQSTMSMIECVFNYAVRWLVRGVPLAS